MLVQNNWFVFLLLKMQSREFKGSVHCQCFHVILRFNYCKILTVQKVVIKRNKLQDLKSIGFLELGEIQDLLLNNRNELSTLIQSSEDSNYCAVECIKTAHAGCSLNWILFSGKLAISKLKHLNFSSVPVTKIYFLLDSSSSSVMSSQLVRRNNHLNIEFKSGTQSHCFVKLEISRYDFFQMSEVLSSSNCSSQPLVLCTSLGVQYVPWSQRSSLTNIYKHEKWDST